MSIFDGMNTANLISGGVSAVGTVLSAIGSFSQGNAILQRGEEENAAAQYTAAQLRQNAGQAMASAERAAATQDRNTKYTLSAGLASAAASGGGASDPTVVNLLARVAGEGAYRTATALYQGQDKARTLNEQADATEYSGKLAEQNAEETKSASDISAFSTLLKGGSSLYDRFADKAPKKTTDQVAG